jgi:serine/threonine-protein kinase
MSTAEVNSSTTIRTATRRESPRPPIREVGDWQLVETVSLRRNTAIFTARPRTALDAACAYCVKMVRDNAPDRELAVALLRREAAVAGKVFHAHLVSVLEAHLAEPPHFLVMPRLEGTTLGEQLKRHHALSLTKSLWIARQTAEALAALHQRGWLHADVKPSNIFVAPDGHVTLIDLGFARRLEQCRAGADRYIAGTLDYIAPEILTPALGVDQRSDIYSLGATLYEMLTGRVPFVARTPAELAQQHRQSKPICVRQLVPDLPKPVASLVHRMLAKEPLRRPQSAEEVVRRLVSLEIDAFAGVERN